VAFSQDVLVSTATNIANYSINHSGPIIGATLANANTVILTTTSWLSNSNVNTLTINGVQDQAGNPIATNTTLTVVTPGDLIRLQSNVGGTNNLLFWKPKIILLNVPAAGHQWDFTNLPPLITGTNVNVNTNFSGTGVMIADPNVAVNLGTPALGSAPVSPA